MPRSPSSEGLLEGCWADALVDVARRMNERSSATLKRRVIKLGERSILRSLLKNKTPAAVVQAAPWHFLYFLPEPHGHGSLRPTLGSLRTMVFVLPASSPAGAAPSFGPVKVSGRRGPRFWRNASGGCSSTICRLNSDRIVKVSMRSSIALNISKL